MQNSSLLVASIAVLKPPQKTTPKTNATDAMASSEYFELGFFKTAHRRAIGPGFVLLIGVLMLNSLTHQTSPGAAWRSGPG
jgi:hypothetical protein